MKHFIILLFVAFMAMMSMNANAQGMVYTPFIPEQSSSYSDFGSWGSNTRSSRSRSEAYRPSSQTQTIRTTAYYVDNGRYSRLPIRVEYTVYSNGASSLTVAEQWEDNGFGGQWKSVLTAANVVRCQSLTANGVTAELEKTFMYKAMVGTRWYYFDL